jgi:GH15 family glucan-1,4-alpha-glucosidase
MTLGNDSQAKTVQLGTVQETTPRIEDHALIGDMRTAALVAKDGSIDWMCLPAFDSDACFAALVGTRKNGYWKVAPAVPVTSVRRRYRKDTLILETDFVTETGTLKLVDFMPPRHGRDYPQVCRLVRCIDGTVRVRSEISPRFAFGRAVPCVVSADGLTKMYAGPDALYLRGGPIVGSPHPSPSFGFHRGRASGTRSPTDYRMKSLLKRTTSSRPSATRRSSGPVGAPLFACPPSTGTR